MSTLHCPPNQDGFDAIGERRTEPFGDRECVYAVDLTQPRTKTEQLEDAVDARMAEVTDLLCKRADHLTISRAIHRERLARIALCHHYRTNLMFHFLDKGEVSDA